MDLRIILLILKVSLTIGTKVSEFELSQENKNLIEALRIIRMELFPCVTGFNLISIADPEFRDLHDAVKMEIIKNSFKTDSLRILNMHSRNRNAVMLIDNIKVFRPEIKLINSRKFQYVFLHVIVLLEGNFEDVHEIFKAFWQERISNVLVLINRNGTLLLGFDPFSHPSKCGDLTPKIINRFQDGKFLEELNLEKGFTNLNLCPMRVTTFTHTVAVFKKVFSNGSYALKGYDIQMIKTIAKMLNFTVEFKFREGIQQWGVIYENGTFTRAMADLKNRNTDILIGHLYLKRSRFQNFHCSTSYLSRPLYLVLSPPPKLNMFEKLLSPFQIPVWIFLLLTFSVGMVVILVIDIKIPKIQTFVYGRVVPSAITNMFRVQMAQSQPSLPNTNFARFILMMFILLCLIIQSLYQGSLYKFLQSDGRHKEPQTFEELINKNYLFIIDESDFDTIEKFKSRMRIKTKPTTGNKEYNLDTSYGPNENTATFTSKSEIMLYSLQHDRFPYKLCKENYFVSDLVYYYNKDFWLNRKIDKVIQDILTLGLVDHWYKEYDRTDKWKNEENEPTVMTFEHLSGAFHLVLIGNVIGTFVFFAEILFFKIKKTKIGHLINRLKL